MERPVECVLVANEDNGIAHNAVTLAAFLAGGANIGELGIFNADTHTAVLGAPGLPARHYYAVKVSATEIRKSPTFNSAPTYLASTQAAAGVPDTCTIGDFTGDCETEYILKIRFESEKIFQTYGYQDLVKTYSYVTRCCSDACGCPDGAAWDVALGITKAINDDRESYLFNQTEYLTGARALANIAAVANDDFDDNVTIQFGSNIMTTSGGWNHSAGETQDGTLAVGDFVRISQSAGGTVAISDSVFRVEAISGTTVTLDRAVSAASRTVTGGSSTDFEVIVAATAEALADSAWTIAVAGGAHATPAVGAMSPFAGVYNNNLISTHIGLLGGFDCNGTVSCTPGSSPKGQAWQVSQLELKYSKNAIGAGNRPSPYRTPFPLSQLGANESLTDAAKTYYVLSITYADGHESAGTIVKSPYVVRLCIDDATTGATKTYEEVVAVLTAGYNGIGGSINADGVILQM